MSDLRGLSARSLKPPGFHIVPQYDLVHLRHLLHSRRRGPEFSLQLAPLVDMFSILTIYLLMNFSTTGDVFFMNQQLTLPMAAKGRPMEGFPLVSVVKGAVIFDVEKVSDDLGQTRVEEQAGEEMPKFRKMLKRLKAIEMRIRPGQPFKGQVNLQADVTTPIDDVKRIMRVLMDEEWMGINFIVVPEK